MDKHEIEALKKHYESLKAEKARKEKELREFIKELKSA